MLLVLMHLTFLLLFNEVDWLCDFVSTVRRTHDVDMLCCLVIRLLCVHAAYVEMVLAYTNRQVWTPANHRRTPCCTSITCLCCWL